MPALTFHSYSEARGRLKDVLDAAAVGVPVLVRREGTEAAVVDARRLRYALARLCPRPEAVAEDGGWSLFISGLPLAADGATFQDAAEEMVDVLREYADDWQDHLKDAVNHRESWGLVQLIELSDDDQLKEWITGPSA